MRHFFLSAFFDAIRDGSLLRSGRPNIVAGLTVGIVALPLSMGLAIASGVPPQHGLYTAIVGGFVIAITGGSRVNISGPTAAFVVILLPVVQDYGLGGLLVSGALAGAILVGLGFLKVGRFIQTIPYPVVVGFTAGIGTVIACLQLKDLLGLTPEPGGIHFIARATSYAAAIHTFQWQETLLGISTLLVIFLWKRIDSPIPGYLVALLCGTVISYLFNLSDALPGVETIADRFSYSVDGVAHAGIPPMAPSWRLPWLLPGPDGNPIGLSFELVHALFGAAFSIAILGALESLLCAVVADGMTGEQHNPDTELIGQGIGNLVVPFFGGIPVTAAIARTALNVRTGGSTPLAAIVHSLFLLVAVLLLARALSLVPMAAMAAVLVAVAWNMSEFKHVVHLVKKAPRPDVAVFAVCYGLTVLVDMQIAITAGLVLAAVMFIRRMSELSTVAPLTAHDEQRHPEKRPGMVIYDVNGPLFFGAAHKALKVILSVDHQIRSVVLDMADVPAIDTTAMVNLRSISELLDRRNIRLYVINAQDRIEQKMRRFGVNEGESKLAFIESLDLVDTAADAPFVRPEDAR